jgi:hypothetical protein
MSIPTGMGDARDLLRPTLGVAAGLVLDRAARQRPALTSQLVPPSTVSLSTRTVTRSRRFPSERAGADPRAGPTGDACCALHFGSSGDCCFS